MAERTDLDVVQYEDVENLVRLGLVTLHRDDRGRLLAEQTALGKQVMAMLREDAVKGVRR